jgi:hypothetical protein
VLLYHAYLAALSPRSDQALTPANVFHRDSGNFACREAVLQQHEKWAYDALRGEIGALKAGGQREREVRAAVRKLRAEAIA